ncbi:MAG: outer-membrane lipoprotein carrier protein LolA [Fibrobacter sp.]|jgi:outer membrane lipoprotein carrier protein|uniref:LolA family protein n=1 Tax=Fibrobacter sp. TaxID=35828 RepID=UPI001B2C9113|nr:outer-membrane lipoprotein carrier protein LolA [Fibrobacter sp.]MBO5531523.1 outer membrane lipoprotein carrier protein LolA [Fibrobacter sp.]MDY6262893.1 outer-membrane lipoprotein carrier protein LolA [Fibrobacter sp.]MDY6386792.1 outer-membrane lipoprotein carrier protein LolA [Fibrobacter sp.]
MRYLLRLFAFVLLFAVVPVMSMTADEAMEKSKAWFKSGKAWNLTFRVQVFYVDSPEIASQDGKLLVAEGDRFVLDMAGIKFYSDGESLWQHNVEQNQVLIKAVEDLSSSLHPSELLFKYLNCKAKSISEGEFGGEKLWVLKLDPSKYAGQFTQMEVWLSKKDFSPKRLFTVDPSGNGSWYNIVNLKVMKKVSAEDFKYKPIKGVDEIDMR